MEHVSIQNPDMAWPIAANIFFPPDFDRDHTYPTVVALHPFGSCKEQTAGNVYGPALAKDGFVVIVYDASFQGESGGSPRWIEDPTQRVEDVSRVIDYAVTLPYVDADRIGVLGVCGGGGYALNATLTEKRIKAVVSIKGVNIGRLFREDFSQFNPLGALDAMAAHRTAEARGEEPQVNELLPRVRRRPRRVGKPIATCSRRLTTTRRLAGSVPADPPGCCSRMRRKRSPGMPLRSPRPC